MSNPEILKRIADLYPQVSDEEHREIEETLRQYLGIVKRIFENVRTQKPEILTELRRRARLRKERQKKALG